MWVNTSDALPCHIHLPVCLWLVDPHSRAGKKNTSHWNEVLRQDSYTDFVTNEEVCAGTQQTIGPHGDLPTIVKRRKLMWYEYVSRSSGPVKTILQGTVRGGRRQGRQKKRWEDNIRDWTGLEFAKSQRIEDNREEWRDLVVKSSVVPQRPPRLRDNAIQYNAIQYHFIDPLREIASLPAC